MLNDPKAKAAADSKKRMRLRHKKHYQARNAVSNAIRDGRLKKGTTCEICGQPPRPEKGFRQLQAHHADYDKPLDVTWVHSACHDRIHFPKETSDASE